MMTKNKKARNELEKMIRAIYYVENPDFMMTPEKMHRIFDGMDMEYKPGFYEFLKNNYTEILADEELQSNVGNIQRQWEEISNFYMGQRITFEKCEAYMMNRAYEGVEYPELVKSSSAAGYSQDDFNAIQEIYKEQKERKVSSIPQIEGKVGKSGYKYTVLRLDDPTTIFVGILTGCCQRLGWDAESCMRHSATSPNGRILVVQDEDGKILAQSWLWRNKNVLCFDNIEVASDNAVGRKIVTPEVLETVKKAAKDFVEQDKIRMQKYKEQKIQELEEQKSEGKLTEEEVKREVAKVEEIVKGQQLNKVTVGEAHTDVRLSGLEYDDENKYPEEYVKYINDSRTQLILYKDDTIEHEDTGKKTVALYEDSEDSEVLRDVDIKAIKLDEWRSLDDDDGFEEDDDEEYDYDDEEYDEEYDGEYDEDYDEGYDEDEPQSVANLNFSALSQTPSTDGSKISLSDIKGAIEARSKAQIALEEIKKANEERKKAQDR